MVCKLKKNFTSKRDEVFHVPININRCCRDGARTVSTSNTELFVLGQHVLDAVGGHTAVHLLTDFDDGSKTAGTDTAEAGQ